MAFENPDNSGTPLNTHRLKPAIAERFSNPLDCLTAHLMLECSEVLAGVKPANLVSLVNRTRPCGRNLYELWHSNLNELTGRFADITFLPLQTGNRAILLLCYNKNHLEKHLAHAGIRTLLEKAGYSSDAHCGQLLHELCNRIGTGKSFPHEIGLFIGYPAKDVAAFMGLVKLPFACQGPWKIYGSPAKSLDLAAVHKKCRREMSDRLLSIADSASNRFHQLISEPVFLPC